MPNSRESLHNRIERFERGRGWVLPVGLVIASLVVVRLIGLLIALGRPLVSGFGLVALAPVLVAVCLLIAVLVLKRANRRPSLWDEERALAAAEVAQAESRDPLAVPEEAARLFQGDVPNLDEALARYQLASGSAIYPRFERLPRQVYGSRVDACARLGDEGPIVCFTPAMLETFSSAELLAVVAHLLARAEQMRECGDRRVDGVREADAKALMITRDHVALLHALESSRTGPVQLALPGDREAWFSEDEAVPERNEDGQVVKWRRIDRVEDLRQHLGPLGMDVPLPSADIRLARLFDVESGELTPAAKDGLLR